MLHRRSGNGGASHSRKYVVSSAQRGGADDNALLCGPARLQASDHTTDPWLVVQDVLKASDRSGVLRGQLEAAGQVVVKVGQANTLQKEYDLAGRLRAAGVPGFVKPHCTFTCDDDFLGYTAASMPRPVCSGRAGTRMRALVVPFYRGASVRSFDWNPRPGVAGHADEADAVRRTLPLVLRDAALHLCCAYDRCGLIFNDSHLDNIMLEDGAERHLAETVTICGEAFELRPDPAAPRSVWIDLENAMLDGERRNPGFLYADLLNMVQHAAYDLDVAFDQAALTRLTLLLQSYQVTRRALDAAVVAAIAHGIATELRPTGRRTPAHLYYNPAVW